MSPRHIIRAQDFDRTYLEHLFAKSNGFQYGSVAFGDILRDKIIVQLFYEPSTRTRFSFESATLRLGGSIIGTENGAEFSSAVKGESLEDSIRVISEYGDAIVLRHTESNAAERAARVASVPIINAGCGIGQHPTQALLDLYTIQEKIGRIDGIHIALCGDLKHGRTIRSLAYLLGKYQDVQITFVSPSELKVEPDILEYLDRHGIRHDEVDTLEKVIRHVDALYVTRIQKERIKGTIDAETLMRPHRVNIAVASQMKSSAIIMHPLPRNDEIDPAVDTLPQAAYFDQARNGLFVRMALLGSILAS